MLANPYLKLLLKLILLLHPVLLIQLMNKLLPQGEVLEAQGEHPLYVLGKSLPTVPGVTNVTDTPTYRQTLFVSCMPNIVLD